MTPLTETAIARHRDDTDSGFDHFPAPGHNQRAHGVVSAALRNPEVPVQKQPAVYILASKRNGTLYIGVTSDLVKRIWEHRNQMVSGFTKRYKIHQLVWYELHENMESAIIREKRLKEWQRKWKLELIEKFNPTWEDLYRTIV